MTRLLYDKNAGKFISYPPVEKTWPCRLGLKHVSNISQWWSFIIIHWCVLTFIRGFYESSWATVLSFVNSVNISVITWQLSFLTSLQILVNCTNINRLIYSELILWFRAWNDIRYFTSIAVCSKHSNFWNQFGINNNDVSQNRKASNRP
jgi:hypothetical protein